MMHALNLMIILLSATLILSRQALCEHNRRSSMQVRWRRRWRNAALHATCLVKCSVIFFDSMDTINLLCLCRSSL